MLTPRTTLASMFLGGALFAWPAKADEDCDCHDGHPCEGGVCEQCPGEDCDCECCNPPAEEGCTPGYWKQDHHFDSWPAALAPEDLFVDVFGIDAFPDQTLLDVLEQGGGGLIALGRHSVAALLNSLSDGVDYSLSDTRVLGGFEHAWDTGDYNKMKDNFEDANEEDCPLN